MPPVVPPLPDLVLFARPGCALCDEAREAIAVVLADRRERGVAVPEFVELDIEADEGLHRAYLERIPVVELGENRLELLVTVGKLRRMLADALDEEPAAPSRWPAPSSRAAPPVGNPRPRTPVDRA
jgi:hypothetical protein